MASEYEYSATPVEDRTAASLQQALDAVAGSGFDVVSVLDAAKSGWVVVARRPRSPLQESTGNYMIDPAALRMPDRDLAAG